MKFIHVDSYELHVTHVIAYLSFKDKLPAINLVPFFFYSVKKLPTFSLINSNPIVLVGKSI